VRFGHARQPDVGTRGRAPDAQRPALARNGRSHARGRDRFGTVPTVALVYDSEVLTHAQVLADAADRELGGS